MRSFTFYQSYSCPDGWTVERSQRLWSGLGFWEPGNLGTVSGLSPWLLSCDRFGSATSDSPPAGINAAEPPVAPAARFASRENTCTSGELHQRIISVELQMDMKLLLSCSSSNMHLATQTTIKSLYRETAHGKDSLTRLGNVRLHAFMWLWPLR